MDVENIRDLFRGMRAGDYFRFGEVTVSEFLDWSSISIKWPEAKMTSLC